MSSVWRLPGRRGGVYSKTKAQIAAAFAYSRQYNPRNLESYWYPVYEEILKSLVEDSIPLVVMSQPTLWLTKESDERENTPGDVDQESNGRDNIPSDVDPDTSMNSTSSGHSTEGSDEHENTSSDADPDVSVDSITSGLLTSASGHLTTSGHLTIPEASTPTCIPDYAIYFIKAIWRNPDFPNPRVLHFKHMRIVHAGIPLIVEIKHYCKRAPAVSGTALPGHEKLKAVRLHMQEAFTQTYADARMLFQMYPEQKEVIVMGCSGPWWSYTTLLRDEAVVSLDHSPDGPFQLPRSDEIEEQGHDEAGAWSRAQEVTGNWEDMDLEEAEESDASSDDDESRNSEVEPINPWSAPFLLESRPSTSALRNIHNILARVNEQLDTPQAWC